MNPFGEISNPCYADTFVMLLGYGKCQFHWELSEASWDRQRKALIGRIECGAPFTACKKRKRKKLLDFNDLVTDVAGEMDALTDTFADCKTCHKACIAAVEMLAVRSFPNFLSLPSLIHEMDKYKCTRMPRRVDQIPNIY